MSNIIFLVFALWLALVLLVIYNNTKPDKKIIAKYGQPLHHFSTPKCWKTLPIKGSRVNMDFYPEFIVVVESWNEQILDKKFEHFTMYESFINPVLEIEQNGKTLQISLTKKQKRLIETFFDI